MTDTMHEDILRVLVSEEELRNRVRELGEEISRDYRGKEPVLLGVLKGCFVFMADLLRSLTIQCNLDFMAVSSYGNGVRSTGAVQIKKDLSRDIEDKDVLIVEDILDSGKTLHYLRTYLAGRKPRSIRIATLLDKPARRVADVQPDYTGFTVPDDFVVGYGLDYAEYYRNLPYIGVLKPEIYQNRE